MEKTIEEVYPKIKNGDISPVELVEDSLQRIKDCNENSKIYITVCEKNALEEAYQAEIEIGKGYYRGPLHGIPFCCKDMFETAGIKTTGGSKVLGDYIPHKDAFLIQKLKERGSILLGKTNQHEFAYGITGINPHFGTVANPFNNNYLAGGSSSGSAASVALGLSFFSLGTDTGGSTRVPASLCGIVGLKPTYGTLSCEGVIPYCWSLDHVGILTRTVNDSKIVLSSLINTLANEAKVSYSFAGLRIGIPSSFFFEGLEPSIAQKMEELQHVLRDKGAIIKSITFPDLRFSRTVSLILQLVEGLSYHSRYFHQWNKYGSDIRNGLTMAQFFLAEDYVRARRIKNMYREQMKKVFKEVDCLLTPTTPCVAPRIDASSIFLGSKEVGIGNALTLFTSFFCVTGNPAISIPCGRNSRNLPFGAQIIGDHGKEKLVLSVASVIEEVTSFH